MTEIFRKYHQVFVNSTYEDLWQERQEVTKALLKTDCFPVGMELLPSSNVDTWELTKSLLDNCDFFILIINQKYGSSPKGEMRSFVEMIYDYAILRGLPLRIYIKEDIKFDENESAIQQNRLKAFIDKILERHIVNFWASTSDLKEKLLVDLYHIIPTLQRGLIRQYFGEDKEKTHFSRRVFIVHGRDHYFRDSLVYLLKNLDFEPIVLQDEPSKSLTIIEKLERDTGQIGFSFVLYTSDDLGHLPGDAEKSRARQNVVFEHGLLIGLLGRERTCAIIKGDLEIPSDIQGMIYENIQDIKTDALKIARVLKEAGYEIDGTKLL